MPIKLPLVLLLVGLQGNVLDFTTPTLFPVRQPSLKQSRVARLPVHLVPSMDRMQPPPRTLETTRVYLQGPIRVPELESPYLVPHFDSMPPAIRLDPPNLELNKSPIHLSPPSVAPDQMRIRLETPIAPPSKTPIQLTPRNFEAPSYPFPTITAPQ